MTVAMQMLVVKVTLQLLTMRKEQGQF